MVITRGITFIKKASADAQTTPSVLSTKINKMLPKKPPKKPTVNQTVY